MEYIDIKDYYNIVLRRVSDFKVLIENIKSFQLSNNKYLNILNNEYQRINSKKNYHSDISIVNNNNMDKLLYVKNKLSHNNLNLLEHLKICDDFISKKESEIIFFKDIINNKEYNTNKNELNINNSTCKYIENIYYIRLEKIYNEISIYLNKFQTYYIVFLTENFSFPELNDSENNINNTLTNSKNEYSDKDNNINNNKKTEISKVINPNSKLKYIRPSQNKGSKDKSGINLNRDLLSKNEKNIIGREYLNNDNEKLFAINPSFAKINNTNSNRTSNKILRRNHSFISSNTDLNKFNHRNNSINSRL